MDDEKFRFKGDAEDSYRPAGGWQVLPTSVNDLNKGWTVSDLIKYLPDRVKSKAKAGVDSSKSKYSIYYFLSISLSGLVSVENEKGFYWYETMSLTEILKIL